MDKLFKFRIENYYNVLLLPQKMWLYIEEKEKIFKNIKLISDIIIEINLLYIFFIFYRNQKNKIQQINLKNNYQIKLGLDNMQEMFNISI